MTFDQESHPRLKFEHNQLKVVVGQVRFPTAFALSDPAVHALIQAEVADRFPVALGPLQEVTFGLTPEGPTRLNAQRGPIRFADKESQQIISISPEMASFETTFYTGWEDFQQAFEYLLDLIGRHASLTQLTRFGLRYVDEIAVEGVVTTTDWARVIAPSALGADGSLARDPRAIRTEQRVIIPLGEDGVNVLHALVRDPANLGSSTFVIDTDLFTESPQPWDSASIIERAVRYHLWMTNIFVRSLTAEGIQLLGGSERR